ncbi:MAG: ABC transporter transmembrane domain-containing protein [Bacteroidota bacterium]|nr:ABC transporter transmembrane domain-containing protein [Bacteroidota bacterium]
MKKSRFKLRDLKGFSQIAPYLKPHKWGFILGIILLSLSGVLTLLVTRLWGQLGGVGVLGDPGKTSNSKSQGFEAEILQNWNLNDLSTIGIVIAIVLIIQALLSFIRVFLFADMTEKMMLAMRKDAFEAIVSMPMDFYHDKRVGDLNSRISADITAIQDTFTTTLAELIRQLIIVGGGVAALAYFSVELTLLMLGTLPVVIIVAIFFGKFIKRLSKETQDEIAASNVIVQEVLTGIVNVKAFANEWFERKRYTERVKSVRSLAMKGAMGRGAFASFIILFIFGAITLVIFKGAALMQQGELASEHFFTFLLMTGLVAGSIGGLAAEFGMVQKGLGAVESLMEILKEEREIKDFEATSAPLDLNKEIEFKGVDFHYEQRPDVPVLKGFNLKINEGEQVALVGPSGAGKSTVASLLLRFQNPIKGQITIGDLDASSLDLRGYRKSLAYVPQEVILFGEDIRTNIAYGNIEATNEEVKEAARRAYALEFIEEFPDGFETLVGERGIQLSGGQRQRIAIARAILRDPDLLILDEATSALDSVSETEVQKALDELMKGRSTLVIAHRLSTIKKAHKIAVLRDGSIIEEGSHNELMAKKGSYYNQVKSQEITA